MVEASWPAPSNRKERLPSGPPATAVRSRAKAPGRRVTPSPTPPPGDVPDLDTGSFASIRSRQLPAPVPPGTNAEGTVVRKIDAFAHILPPSYARRLEPIMSGDAVSERILGYQPWIREDPALIDLDARWRVMDAFGDYVQVLTLAVPPPAELGGPALARDLARAANDELAELVRGHPDRFAGFSAALPMNDIDAAARELDRAITQLGALGTQLHTNVGGAPLDERRFAPVFETVTRLDGAVWIHPRAARPGRTTRRRAGPSTASGGPWAGRTRRRRAWRGWCTRVFSTPIRGCG